jgi:hypothetical protein
MDIDNYFQYQQQTFNNVNKTLQNQCLEEIIKVLLGKVESFKQFIATNDGSSDITKHLSTEQKYFSSMFTKFNKTLKAQVAKNKKIINIKKAKKGGMEKKKKKILPKKRVCKK